MLDDTGVGCGNCVLKIYTNNSGLPAYELCGENKSYSGMTILSQGNSMRLKYVISTTFFFQELVVDVAVVKTCRHATCLVVCYTLYPRSLESVIPEKDSIRSIEFLVIVAFLISRILRLPVRPFFLSVFIIRALNSKTKRPKKPKFV